MLDRKDKYSICKSCVIFLIIIVVINTEHLGSGKYTEEQIDGEGEHNWCLIGENIGYGFIGRHLVYGANFTVLKVTKLSLNFDSVSNTVRRLNNSLNYLR